MEPSLWSKLPEVLMELVFARLPIACIFRLRTLSKRWESVIFSPSFQQAFHASFHMFGILCRERYESRSDSLSSYDLRTFDTQSNEWSIRLLKSIFLASDFEGSIVAASGGLVCLHWWVMETETLRVIVCNPLTSAWRELPPNPDTHTTHPRMVHMMMDSHTKNYVVIVGCSRSGSNSLLNISVYDSGTDRWSGSDLLFGALTNNLNKTIFCKVFDRVGYNVGLGYALVRLLDKQTAVLNDLPTLPALPLLPPQPGSYHPCPPDKTVLTGSNGLVFAFTLATMYVWEFRSADQTWVRITCVPESLRLDYDHDRAYYCYGFFACGDVLVIVEEGFFYAECIQRQVVTYNKSKDEWRNLRELGREVDDSLEPAFSGWDIMVECRLDAKP